MAGVSPDFTAWRLRDRTRGEANWRSVEAICPPGKRNKLRAAFDRILPATADPDSALNHFERLVATGKFFQLAENLTGCLEALLPLFAASQFLSDVLVRNPEYLSIVEQPTRYSPPATELADEAVKEALAAPDDAGVLRTLRRFRQRHTFRIGFNDIVRERPLEEITLDLSNVADACIEAALQAALRSAGQRFGVPSLSGEVPSRCVVLAFGKLGASELNYSSDIDLMLVYDEEGQTRGKRGISNQEFYARVVPEVVRLLSAHSPDGSAYRVDLRLRPEGQSGPLARSLASTLRYYDTLGRTWERQALIKVRPAAGHLPLGREFLLGVEPFVYSKYLSFSEINGIKAMKRRIEQKTKDAGLDDREVKTGRGGIRDIEFTIQFLQLLNAGDMVDLRKRSTFTAIVALQAAGCLTYPEYQGLDDGYRFLRKLEHRLQLLFDLQTHRIPEEPEEMRKLARRMGYTEKERPRSAPRSQGRAGEESAVGAQKFSPLDEELAGNQLDTRLLVIDPLDQFLLDYNEKTNLNRTILDHLLHSCFSESAERAEPETDLVLDPDPDERTIQRILGRHSFRDVPLAYRNLMELAKESTLFLSTRRCRHFLASIAPRLLSAIAETPDPDLALGNLAKVTDSLGGKAVLWELFSFNPPSLKLVVDICSNSPFLSDILINNPGMIDELLDSLVLNQPRGLDELKRELAELTKGVDQPEAVARILHSFQDKEMLRVGVRDLLGKDRINETTAELSDLAESLLETVVERQLPTKVGVPTLPDGKPCRFAVLGLGKLGGREMGYHSDLDIVLLYEGDGVTQPDTGHSHYFKQIDNFVYFTELAQRVIRVMGSMGSHGKLYEVDMRLRPTGKSGSLVVPMDAFQRYFASGGAQVWERQAMTRARPIFGEHQFTDEAMKAVREAITGIEWGVGALDDIRAMRKRLEAHSSTRDLKRGPGGIADVEFAVQLLQIKYGRGFPHILQTNVWEALDALYRAGFLPERDHMDFKRGYSFLRQAESRLRIVTNRACNEYPGSDEELDKLARRLGIPGMRDAKDFREETTRVTTGIRKSYDAVLGREQE